MTEAFDPARSPLELVKVYGLIGPAVGGVTLVGLSMLADGPPDPDPMSVPVVMLASIPLGYLFGGLPALVTGTLAGILRLMVTGWPYVLIVTALGAVISFPLVVVISGGLAFMAGIPSVAVAGAAGALVCAVLTMRPRKRRALEAGEPPGVGVRGEGHGPADGAIRRGPG